MQVYLSSARTQKRMRIETWNHSRRESREKDVLRRGGGRPIIIKMNIIHHGNDCSNIRSNFFECLFFRPSYLFYHAPYFCQEYRENFEKNIRIFSLLSTYSYIIPRSIFLGIFNTFSRRNAYKQ